MGLSPSGKGVGAAPTRVWNGAANDTATGAITAASSHAPRIAASRGSATLRWVRTVRSRVWCGRMNLLNELLGTVRELVVPGHGGALREGRSIQINDRTVRVGARIAEGGCATVYHAEDASTGERFALKHMLLDRDSKQVRLTCCGAVWVLACGLCCGGDGDVRVCVTALQTNPGCRCCTRSSMC